MKVTHADLAEYLVSSLSLHLLGNENGEPVIAERQIRIMDKPLGQRHSDDGKEYVHLLHYLSSEKEQTLLFYLIQCQQI